MPAAKKAKDDAPEVDDKLVGDSEARNAEELDKGFVGDKVDPLPNSDHSLESGPEAPPVNAA